MIDRVFTWSEGVQCIHATDAGLWLGHQGGVSFFSPETGSRCKWTTSNGLPAQPVLHIASCGSRLAVATPNGIAWVDDTQQLLQDDPARCDCS
jgi:ligand-binding sensor domain-containing protein